MNAHHSVTTIAVRFQVFWKDFKDTSSRCYGRLNMQTCQEGQFSETNQHVSVPQTEEEFLENLTQGFTEEPVDGDEEDDEPEDDDEDDDGEEFEDQEKENSLNISSQSLSSPLVDRAGIAPMVFALKQEGKTHRHSIELKHFCVGMHSHVHQLMYMNKQNIYWGSQFNALIIFVNLIYL